jgi:predicted enzyme related to lactoylglutathione lyase
MSEQNSLQNLAVWFDIPVADLDRASAFYAATLDIGIDKVEMENSRFCVFHHDTGNGGCLILDESAISSSAGVLMYMNVDGRIRDAVVQAGKMGGRVVEPVHSIGPHGFRAIILDSEGNRIALHSTRDA